MQSNAFNSPYLFLQAGAFITRHAFDGYHSSKFDFETIVDFGSI
jgi:hypothetical protein